MPRADLQIWAETIVIDPIKNTPNRLSISGDLYDKGWLRTNPVAGQHLNQILYDLTFSVKNETLEPAQNLADLTDASQALVNLGIDTTLYLEKSQNLADIPSPATARDNLGLNIDNLYNTFFDTIYPVGTVYENKTNSANPATYLGRGTWVAEGEGRVAIGAGTGTDINAVMQSFTAGTTGGEYVHTLTLAEMPSHTHSYIAGGGGTANANGASTDGDYTPQLTGSAGSDTAHNNVQPYAVYYRWLRTA